MHRVGVVIYLCAPVLTLVNRLEAEPDVDLRPTLTGKPLSEEVQEVLEQRDALYRETAHYIIDATKAPTQVVSKLWLRCRHRRNGYREMSIINAHPEQRKYYANQTTLPAGSVYRHH